MKYFIFLALVLQLSAATRYIDNVAKGANNGTSWADAWTDPVTAKPAPGDMVYISGGPAGGTRSYVLGGSYSQWGAPNGTSAAKITYKIGQDALHNGTAVFSPAKATNQFMFAPDWIIFSGDAGDGNQHFKLSGFGSDVDGVNTNWLLLEYVDFGTCGNMASFNPCLGRVEISHCVVKITGNADHASYASFTGTSYDSTGLIHDCVINLPYDTSLDGSGADGLQWVGSGFSIYGNDITGYPQAGARGNHQDGWQGSGVQWVKIYNNVITDMGNYGLFGELPQNGRVNSNVQIYNNTIMNTRGTGTQAIAFGGDSAAGKINTNVIYTANTAIGFSMPLTLRNPNSTSDARAFVACYVYGNQINKGSNILDPAVFTTSPAQPPVVVPPPIVPPVITPPANAKISTSVSSISADGKQITTVITFDKSIYP